MDPTGYAMQGKQLVATIRDGSKKSLVYHASTEAYRAYIQANGGNPSAPIKPSAMSVAAAAGTAPVTAPTSTTAPNAGVIDVALAAQAKQAGGSEYVEGRKSAEGDINGDGTPDLAVLYILEGVGGSYVAGTYLAAFVREEGQLRLVDTVPVGNVKSMVLDGKGAVKLSLLVHGPDDPNCCPSLEEEAVYLLNQNKWNLVPAQS